MDDEELVNFIICNKTVVFTRTKFWTPGDKPNIRIGNPEAGAWLRHLKLQFQYIKHIANMKLKKYPWGTVAEYDGDVQKISQFLSNYYKESDDTTSGVLPIPISVWHAMASEQGKQYGFLTLHWKPKESLPPLARLTTNEDELSKEFMIPRHLNFEPTSPENPTLFAQAFGQLTHLCKNVVRPNHCNIEGVEEVAALESFSDSIGKIFKPNNPTSRVTGRVLQHAIKLMQKLLPKKKRQQKPKQNSQFDSIPLAVATEVNSSEAMEAAMGGCEAIEVVIDAPCVMQRTKTGSNFAQEIKKAQESSKAKRSYTDGETESESEGEAREGAIEGVSQAIPRPEKAEVKEPEQEKVEEPELEEVKEPEQKKAKAPTEKKAKDPKAKMAPKAKKAKEPKAKKANSQEVVASEAPVEKIQPVPQPIQEPSKEPSKKRKTGFSEDGAIVVNLASDESQQMEEEPKPQTDLVTTTNARGELVIVIDD